MSCRSAPERGAPAQEYRQQEHAGGVGERCHVGERLSLLEAQAEHFEQDGVDPGAMRQHHPLGPAGGASGVVETAQVRRLDLDLRRLRGRVGQECLKVEMIRRHLAGILADADVVSHGLELRGHALDARRELLVVHEGNAPRVVHHVDVVVRAQENRQGHSHRSELDQGVLAEHVLRAIRHQEGDPVPLPDPEGGQRVGQPTGLVAELFEGAGAPAKLESHPRSEVGHAAIVQLAYGRVLHRRHPLVSTDRAAISSP
jgi:hypothetical protein